MRTTIAKTQDGHHIHASAYTSKVWDVLIFHGGLKTRVGVIENTEVQVLTCVTSLSNTTG